MASSSGDDEFVILVCTDPNNEIEADISDQEIVISTTDISTWDFPSILSFQTFKIQAHRNRQIKFPFQSFSHSFPEKKKKVFFR